MTLSGAAAFAALADRLCGAPLTEAFGEPPFQRINMALDDKRATPLDNAVLLRHALRFETLRRNTTVHLVTDRLSAEILNKVGIFTEAENGRLRISALPWMPSWLPDANVWPVDETSMRATRRRFFPGDETAGDPFLAAFGMPNYRSPGQRAAIRSALTMPPGSILAIDLPTGEGKSLIFRAIDEVGFACDQSGHAKGTTLVIVPTVTLALDHEKNCGGSDDRPLAYIGGRTGRNATIRAAIEAGQQGLCFAAPEAAAGGPLRGALGRAVSQDKLRAVVIDEAHLVDSWGTGFRTDFQTLAGVCRQWRERVPAEFAFRTVMLSATLSEAAKQTLIDLFAPDGNLPVVAAAKVRPEPEFWVAPLAKTIDREMHVEEALLHLPRPAILYVTKVDDAKSWFQRLTELGFGRIALVHGGTTSDQRESVLNDWAHGALDLVVATSAFGLGIDYAHVRTIIHACVPETFDRFYQEVGRAGRDGCAAISLLLPTSEDLDIAKSLNDKTVISVDRGLQRWTSMFNDASARQHIYPHYNVRLDVAPGHHKDDIDLIGERSIDWNARTLALMARGALINLKGVPDLPPAIEGQQNHPYQDVEIRDDMHLSRSTWEQKIEPKRSEIAAANRASLVLTKRFLAANECPARLVAELYKGADRSVALSCSGCHLCRRDPKARAFDGIVGESPPPWPAQATISPALASLWGAPQRILVQFKTAEPDRRTRRDFENVIRRLDLFGLRVFVSVGSIPDWITNSVRVAVKDRPWFTLAEREWMPVRWPTGARLIAIGGDITTMPEWFSGPANSDAAIIMVPAGAPDGSNPARNLVDVVGCETMELLRFIEKVLA